MDFDRFKYLETYTSPPKTDKNKRKRSTSSTRSKKSSEKNKKVKDENFVLKKESKLKTPVPSQKTPLPLKKTLSRTNLEQKYDSPDLDVVHNISAEETSFIYRPLKQEDFQANKNKYLDENFYQNVRKLVGIENIPPSSSAVNKDKMEIMDLDISPTKPMMKKIQNADNTQQDPQTLNERLNKLMSTFKSPSRRTPRPDGFLQKFRMMKLKRKEENLNCLQSKATFNEDVERKIQIVSQRKISQFICVAKFYFLHNETDEIVNDDDGKEHLASFQIMIHGALLKRCNRFIVKIDHSVDLSNDSVMHDIAHIRAY